ncbi:hypothetical protein EYF80_047197 [Liparis tanakae]|uniref:Uncharacterized protein n=1 Tax=Liparis tanakae TaxID=230148 RepID=A0A4Z2FP25_9TELE|nr:hypothetical protein EYF80_047197 [Liparis tanakae]
MYQGLSMVQKQKGCCNTAKQLGGEKRRRVEMRGGRKAKLRSMYLQMSVSPPHSSGGVMGTITTLGMSLESDEEEEEEEGGNGDGWLGLDSPKKHTLVSSKPSLHRRLPVRISWSTALWKSLTSSQEKLPTWSKTSKQSRCLIFLSSGDSSCSRMWKYPNMKRSRVKLSWVTAAPSMSGRNCSGDNVTRGGGSCGGGEEEEEDFCAPLSCSSFLQEWLRNSTTMRSFLKLVVSITAFLGGSHWLVLKLRPELSSCLFTPEASNTAWLLKPPGTTPANG